LMRAAQEKLEELHAVYTLYTSYKEQSETGKEGYITAVQGAQEAIMEVVGLSERRHDRRFINVRYLLGQLDSLVLKEVFPEHEEWYEDFLEYLDDPNFK